MASVIDEIRRCDAVVSKNITKLIDDRGLMSINIINSLRNLVNQVAILINTQDVNTDSNYQTIESAMKLVEARADLAFLRTFYKRLQVSASHYTLDEDNAERLMLKYYESLMICQHFSRQLF